MKHLTPAISIALTLLALACGSGDTTSGDEAQASPIATEALASETPSTATSTTKEPELKAFKVPAGSRPHDVAPAADGGVWYTAQGSGELGWLNPETGQVKEIALGVGSAPHGVIVGPDGAPWITDGGLNAIVRVDPATSQVRLFPMPAGTPNINMNTAVFDNAGRLWFTGQAGYYGWVDPVSGQVTVVSAPRGRGPYGITKTPAGQVFYASLAGSHIARIDPSSPNTAAVPLDPPTSGQGARRVWSDSKGRVWISEWNAGQLGLYDPAANAWKEWQLPGPRPQAYAVYVDEQDKVWITDFGGNAIHRFDPLTEQFQTFPLPSPNGNVRQLLGRNGEVWGAESSADQLIVIRY